MRLSSAPLRPFALGALSCALLVALAGFRSGAPTPPEAERRQTGDTATLAPGESFLRFDRNGHVVQVIRVWENTMRVCHWQGSHGRFHCVNHAI